MDAVERLHYANGRRLQAADFRLEQGYLVTMRRMLNRGLFTPGVVNGLEVSMVDATHVSVAPGFALDPLGREMVLVSPLVLAVPAQPPSTSLGGYFLVVGYAETRLAGDDPDCAAPSDEAVRIREEPRFDWTEDLPDHRWCGQSAGAELDCAIAIALVTLDAACQITLVDIAPRELARPANSGQVQAFAMEGEKDIDFDNPKRLHFWIRGGTASSVVLYLWADRLSSLYYTQLGQHRHTLSNWSVETKQTDLAAHSHDLRNHTHNLPDTSAIPDHNHALRQSANTIDPKFELVATAPPRLGANIGYLYSSPAWVQAENGHGHTFTDSQGNPVPTRVPVPNATGPFDAGAPSQSHSHTVSVTVDKYGSPTYGDASTGPVFQYFADLVVELDGIDITQEIVTKVPSDFNGRLGDLTPNHPLVMRGTPGIELTVVARAVGQVIDAYRPHELTFRLANAASGGGKLLYNLFVS